MKERCCKCDCEVSSCYGLTHANNYFLEEKGIIWLSCDGGGGGRIWETSGQLACLDLLHPPPASGGRGQLVDAPPTSINYGHRWAGRLQESTVGTFYIATKPQLFLPTPSFLPPPQPPPPHAGSGDAPSLSFTRRVLHDK